MASDTHPLASESVEPRDPPVAIVGIGALYPGSSTAQGFWGDIVAGRDRITDIPATHWRIEDYFDPDPAAPDKIYARRGAFLPAIEFSPLHFGIPPASLPAIDSAQLLALVVAERVIADMAGRAFARVDRDRISVILGVASTTEMVSEMAGRLQRPRWERELRAAGFAEADVRRVTDAATDQYVPWQENTFPGLLGNVVAGRIANRLDLGGSNYVVDAACGSSLAAVEGALNELYLRRADLVITGGVDALNDVLMFTCFSKVGAMSRSGVCRPFAADADGTLLGEGVGMFALKRLDDAERDADHVYAVIRAIGSASDRRALSIYAPRPEGQAKALARAYARAGYGPETVDLVEAHGTGTRAGDVAEVEGLRLAFDAARARGTQWCALGSVKSQIGHTKAASGAAGLFKVAMALHHKVLPPTINVDRPDPRLALDESPFYLNTRARPWVKAPGTPRRASVSSFGFGGTNFHLTLEEYDGPAGRAPRLRTMPSELLLFSAADRGQLIDACRAAARRLAAPDTAPEALDAIARDTQAAFSAQAAERLAIVAVDAAEGARELDRVATALSAGRAVNTAGVHHGHGEALTRIAMLFPGQGSQYVGMGADLAMHFEAARRVWDRAADLDGDSAGGPARFVFPPPAFGPDGDALHDQALRATERAQPAIATASAAAMAVLGQIGIAPSCVAGHSLGELTALSTAGVFDLETLVAAATARGRAMAAAAHGRPSTMTAVLAPRERVDDVIRPIGAGVVVANHNAPGQTVISGELESIAEAEAALASLGVAFRRLPVAAAFHSPLFAEAAGAVEQFLLGCRIQPPALPVYSHVTAAPYAEDAATVAAQLGRAVVSPVRFVEQIEALYRDGVRIFVEPGPDAVLTRLVSECLGDRPHVAVAIDRRGVNGVTSLWRGIGALAAAGVAMDLRPLWEDQVLSSDHVRPADSTTVRICGANFGKRYPPADGDAERPAATPVSVVPAVTEPSTARPDPTAAAPVHTPVGDAPSDAWLDAFTAVQQQTAAAHADFQRLVADRHEAFLRISADGLRQLAAIAGAAPIEALAPVTIHSQPARVDRAPEPAPADEGDDVMRAAPTWRSIGRTDVDVSSARETPAIAPTVAADPAASDTDRPRADVLLDIVAEKTGYPREALALGMDLESDLGIDSIKRVEILAAANQRMPGLPRLQTEKLSAMRTLAQIAGYLDSAAAGAAAPVGVAAAPLPAAAPAAIEPPAPVAASSQAAIAPPAMPVRIEHSIRSYQDAVAPGFAAVDLWDGEPLYVAGDASGIGRALARCLARDGITAHLVETPPPTARRLIVVGSLTADSVDHALAIARRSIAVVASGAHVWSESDGLLVTVDPGHDVETGGGSAWLGGLTALCRTARVELPRLIALALEVDGARDDAEATARIIATELLSGGGEPEVRLDLNGRRRRPRLEPGVVAPGRLPIDRGAVLVAAGGARGITAEAVIALARQMPLRALLLGRTPLEPEPDGCQGVTDQAELGRLVLQHARARGADCSPSDMRAAVSEIFAAREIARTLARLRESGSEARYAAVDVSDARAVTTAVDAARRDWGPIDALIHGAGALADAWLRDKTGAHVDRVFAPKLSGLANLLAATADDPLRLLCGFSSIAAHAANAGQADYAMANAILERVLAVEAARRGPSCQVRALAWGPWDAGMVTPLLREKFARDGVGLVETAAGTAAMLREFSSPSTATTVVLTAGRPGARAEATPGEGSFVVTVTPALYPELADHRIKGRMVVPMALVVEWLGRLVRLLNPDASRLRLGHLQVLRPVVVPDRTETPVRLTLQYRRDADGRAALVRLVDSDGKPCYEGTMLLAIDSDPTAPVADGVPQEGQASAGPDSTADGLSDAMASAHSIARSVEDLYDDGPLFHGPRFQVLREVDSVSASFARARLATTSAMGWPGTYIADPAMVDGALQLALVWAFEATGQRCVPMRFGAVDVALDARPAALVTATLVAPPISGATLRASVRVSGEDGAALVDIRDVEGYAIPIERSPIHLRPAVASDVES